MCKREPESWRWQGRLTRENCPTEDSKTGVTDDGKTAKASRWHWVSYTAVRLTSAFWKQQCTRQRSSICNLQSERAPSICVQTTCFSSPQATEKQAKHARPGALSPGALFEEYNRRQALSRQERTGNFSAKGPKSTVPPMNCNHEPIQQEEKKRGLTALLCPASVSWRHKSNKEFWDSKKF